MRRWREWAAPVTASLAGLVLHARAVRAPFFADDWLFLDQVRERSPWAALAAPDPIGNYFRPLGRALWFAALGGLSHESALAFHVANLALFLACIALVWAIARRVHGPRAAAVAGAFFALTCAADVPVRWASGSQDLLAITLALAAMLAFVRERRWLAASLLFLAPFAKEVVALAPIPAALLARRPGEPWRETGRRAWPLALAMLAWAAVNLAVTRHAGGMGAGHVPGAAAVVASLANAARVATGLEWRAGGVPFVPFRAPDGAGWMALFLAAAAVGLAFAPAPRVAPAGKGRVAPAITATPGERTRHAWLAGAAWIVVAALPIAFVAPIWSAYFYLFAMGGAALALGVLLARAGRVVAVAAVVVLGLAAYQARALDEFATAPATWSAQSHVNDFYLGRGMTLMSRCLESLKAVRPSLPPRATVFFGGLPSFSAFQTGDGPLVRGVYRDTSLRSYFITDFSRDRARRGPDFFLDWDPKADRFMDSSDAAGLWVNLGVRLLLDDRATQARDAFETELDRDPVSGSTLYALALVTAEQGDTAGARALFERCQVLAATGAGEAMTAARGRLAAGDSAGARRIAEIARVRAVLDPEPHVLLSRLYLAGDPAGADGYVEAFAARAVAPGDAAAWRHWAEVQMRTNRDTNAMRSLGRYFALDPAAESNDAEARGWRDALRARLPGGAVMQQAMKGDVNVR